ncbi:MAG TPA: DUF1127 domain-containing protein [Skermanella sp.]|jgi:uncharacterized protein YjiS (DUF1127 family)|nr:DUF1127 domain-containing protein [Skermanella sp.]
MTAYTNTNELIQPTISGFSGYNAASPVARVLSALQKLPVYLRQYWTLYQTREELSRLSDRSLSDIGIDRDNIATIARNHCDQALIRHDETGRLLAMTDEELADIGVSRGDVEAYRNGRIKFLRRRYIENEAAA